MKYVVTISRVLLGLIFVVFGLNGFLHFIPSPQYQGVAGQFIGAIFTSHFYIVVFLTQIFGGLLLLADRYVGKLHKEFGHDGRGGSLHGRYRK